FQSSLSGSSSISAVFVSSLALHWLLVRTFNSPFNEMFVSLDKQSAAPFFVPAMCCILKSNSATDNIHLVTFAFFALSKKVKFLWSVIRVKFRPLKYTEHLCIEKTIAHASFSYTDHLVCTSVNAFEINVRISVDPSWRCNKIPPIPKSLASVYNSNVESSATKPNVTDAANNFFIFPNAFSCLSSHWNLSFFIIS
ncbi:hypothetical protein ADUPG1_003642, partial [Aduncisulcus paluster]